MTPPVNDDADVVENNSILKLAVQTKYSDQDIDLLTKMEVSIPMKRQELRHRLKNIAGLAGHASGATYVVHRNLLDVVNHVERK